MWLIRRLVGKKERKMKNERRHGHSARNGNSPSPYQKYNKKPYHYNTKAWATRWPTLASTLWDQNRAGRAMADEVHRDQARRDYKRAA
jgi:hypothetical protein